MEASIDRLSRRVTATLCVLLAVVAAFGLHHWTRGGSAWTYDELRLLDAEAGRIQAPPLRLQGGANALWGEAHEPKRVYLVNFIYTRCPSICLALGSEYQRMQSALEAEPAPVHLVSLSIDPARDGTRELSAWAQRQRADPAWWTVGHANTRVEAEELLRALRVVVVSDGSDGFVHNGAIHLIDAQGHVLALFDYTRWPQALMLARTAARQAAGAPP
jgi:protein SCO1